MNAGTMREYPSETLVGELRRMIAPAWRKEIRALFYAWLLTFVGPLVLTGLGGYLRSESLFGWGLIIFLFGTAALGGQSFGHEFEHRVMPQLLTQPVERRRLWTRKMMVLWAALVSVTLSFVASLVWNRSMFAQAPTEDLAWGIAFLVVLVFSAGCAIPLLTLATRSTIGGIVLSFALMGLVCLISRALPAVWCHFRPQAAADADRLALWLGALLFLVYWSASLRLGYSLFLRLETPDGAGQELRLPKQCLAFTSSASSTSSLAAAPATRQSARPIYALFRKEVGLQQGNFLFAGIIVAFLVLLLLVNGHVLSQELALEDFTVRTVYWGLWGFLPVLIGAAAVAEERRLGVIEWQQIQPVASARQWRVKLLSVLSLSVVMGAIVPWLLGYLAFPLAGMDPAPAEGLHLAGGTSSGGVFRSLLVMASGMGMSALVYVVPYSLIAGTLSLYASSQARSTVQALGLLVAWVAAAGLGLSVLGYITENLWPPPAPLFLLVAGPVFAVVMYVLGFENYQTHPACFTAWRRNAATLAAVLLCVVGVTAAVYTRSWESVLPDSTPSAGPRLAGPGKPKLVAAVNDPVVVLLPDGSLWKSGRGREEGEERLRPQRIPGSWLDLAGTYQEVAAVRSDGTLWAWGVGACPTTNQGKVKLRACYLPIHQVGTDRDWKSISMINRRLAAVKVDGTLWQWLLGEFVESSEALLAPEATQPQRLGSASNWVATAQNDHEIIGLRTDGSAWAWRIPAAVGPRRGGANAWEARRIGAATNWVAVVAPHQFALGLQADGSLWAWGLVPPWLLPWQRDGHPPTRLAAEARWSAIDAGWDRLIVIKPDGSLWSWLWGRHLQPDLIDRLLGGPFRLGPRSDWVATATMFRRSYGLTADGKVWTLDFGRNVDSEKLPWTRPARRVQLVADLAQAR